MKRKLSLLLFALMLGSVIPSASWAQDDPLDQLTPEHRKWLEEEVPYIILDRERDVFLSLKTVEERDRFIEAFWKKRDPNPATPENEFKVEHYRRLDYANKFLGRETFLPGWKTDRGRMYIILGEPQEIQRFEEYSDIRNVQLWFYQGDPAKGLPSFFYLLFFKRDDVGEYRLYRPMADGPNELVRGFESHGLPQNAIAVLKDVSLELARASLSLDPSDPADLENARPSLGSEAMLARVYDSPKRAIRADYVDAWLEYGDRVSADYSFNFVPNRSVFVVLQGPEATPFVNYSIEIDPKDFTMEADEDQAKVYTTLDVSVEVRDKEGELVLANEREVYIELTPAQLEQVKASPFAQQADFPLLPGEYKISVILRNRILKQYTVAEKDVVVRPIPTTVPAMSDIVLGYSVDMMRGDASGEQELRAFQVGNVRVHPAAEGTFALGDTVHLFLQVQGAGPDYRLHYSLMNEEEEVLDERTTEMSSYLGGPVIERFPLRGLVGGRYQYRVELIDPSGKLVDERVADCQVSPRAGVARPWVNRTSFNTASPGLVALARGDQLLAKKRFAEARAEYERAVSQSGEALPPARWQLARVSIQMGEPDRAIELLTPLESSFPNQFEVVAGLGLANSLQGNCTKGVGYLEKAMTLRPPDTTLLNVLGGCYQTQGNLQKASEMLERSLKLNPGQEDIKERLASLQQGGN